MGDFISTANGLIALATGLVGLISTLIGIYFAVKNFIEATKQKSSKEIWNMIMTIADAAMKEAEQSSLKGAAKKEMALNIIKISCATAGIHVEDFLDQLSAYIDQSVDFVNSFKK